MNKSKDYPKFCVFCEVPRHTDRIVKTLPNGNVVTEYKCQVCSGICGQVIAHG